MDSLPAGGTNPPFKLSRRAGELLELEAKAKPLSKRDFERLTLETARSYYDTQCEAMSRHLEYAGNSAFEIGRTLYWVNEQLGNSRAELEAWLAKSEHPRSVSGAYQGVIAESSPNPTLSGIEEGRTWVPKRAEASLSGVRGQT